MKPDIRRFAVAKTSLKRFPQDTFLLRVGGEGDVKRFQEVQAIQVDRGAQEFREGPVILNGEEVRC